MICVKARSAETGKVLNFYVSNNVPNIDEFIECLNYIRYGWSRNWKVVSHMHVSTELSVKPPRMEMKYIVLKGDDDTLYQVVFDKSINHDFMSLAACQMSEEFLRPVSAGFTDGLTCYGRSETLNKNSNPEVDTKILNEL